MGVWVSSPYSEEKGEECGIFGILAKNGDDVAPLLYRALIALQHRGQDAAGFAIYNGKTMEARRGIGLVSGVFKPEDLTLKGGMGIGHTRYPTIGECRMCDVQPSMYKDIAVAHNGHVANYGDLKKTFEEKGHKYTSTVDSEPMVFALAGSKGFEEGAKWIMERFEGSYSDVCIYNGVFGVFRDPHAIRPLVWGENESFIAFASETVALDINNIPYKGEVKGGELVIVDGGKMVRKQLVPETPRHCMFEYVYFARPDSTINGKSVYEARSMLGEALAREAPAKVDVVVPVPDTSRTAAARYARKLGVPCEEGLIKNRYIGRTFIMANQSKRVGAVKLKLNPVREIIRGKSVALVDDSIVRGTTLKEIVALVRKAGAKEVHLRITCPPVKAPCFYGVDMSTYKELIADDKSVDAIGKFLGADTLAYISMDGLKKAIGLPLCTACLGGEYHTDYVRKLAEKARGS
ncbi:amidophosphoribosyltransferase [Candidatus Micrarchaeota archaeon]|nr:amidophosphoribosyltransferase [Candidatus Micrarchaeota archaeon]